MHKRGSVALLQHKIYLQKQVMAAVFLPLDELEHQHS